MLSTNLNVVTQNPKLEEIKSYLNAPKKRLSFKEKLCPRFCMGNNVNVETLKKSEELIMSQTSNDNLLKLINGLEVLKKLSFDEDQRNLFDLCIAINKNDSKQINHDDVAKTYQVIQGRKNIQDVKLITY